jgi:hypothetical protein
MAAEDLEARLDLFQRCIETRDVAGASELLDEDYALVLVHPAPAVMPRARWLEVLPDYVVTGYDVIERVIDVEGDCAAVLHSADQQATALGADRSGRFVVSDIRRRHSTPLSAGEMPT